MKCAILLILVFTLLVPSCLLAFAPSRTTPCPGILLSPHLHQHHHHLCAKKKKAKKQKKNSGQKQSGFAWANSFTLQPYEAQSTRELVSTSVASFQGRTGKPLCKEVVGASDIPKALWNAPCACVIMDPEGAAVKYANIAALETVGLNANEWDKIMSTANVNAHVNTAVDGEAPPSPTLTLDLPSNMKDKSYESGYVKKILRRAAADDDDAADENDDDEDATAHDVKIVNAHRWKLEKSALVDGKFKTTILGVAYAWTEWTLDDTTFCGPGGQRREMVKVEGVQLAIDQQAKKIRQMKEEQGLGNKDPNVQREVAELLRLKGLLEVD